MITSKPARIQKVLAEPRISVNSLATYLEASSSKRKQIVRDCKYPKGYINTRYKEVRETIKNYISKSIGEDEVIRIMEEMQNIEEYETPFIEQDTRASIEALETLLDSDISLFSGFNVNGFQGKNDLININGVAISVNPDLFLIKTKGDTKMGGLIKLHISKTGVLSQEGQLIVAALLYIFATSIEKDGAITDFDPKLCFSFDLFNKSIECCPPSYKLRMKRIEDACEEISLWWDKL